MRRWDVIVLVFLVVLAVNLLAVGVQRVRDSAQRTECSYNPRLIAVALRNFHDSFQRFPAATWPNDQLPPEKRLSWLLSILPWVESSTTYSQAHKAKSWDAMENRPAGGADHRARRGTQTPGGGLRVGRRSPGSCSDRLYQAPG